MSWKYIEVFEVCGSGNFPIDMLRYDGCWPATELDSNRIAIQMGEQGWNEVRTITLKRYVENKKSRGPTQDRWLSFQWTVKLGSVRILN